MTLTFDEFRRANVARCLKWHPAGIASWSPSDWLTAITGELGELASLLKMRNRERDGLPGNKFSPTDKQIADELADVLTYLDLLAEVLGVSLGAAAVEKFNEVSERVGFPDRIAAQFEDVKRLTRDELYKIADRIISECPYMPWPENGSDDLTDQQKRAVSFIAETFGSELMKRPWYGTPLAKPRLKPIGMIDAEDGDYSPPKPVSEPSLGVLSQNVRATGERDSMDLASPTQGVTAGRDRQFSYTRGVEQKDGVGLIAAERQRQIEKHGYTPEHDGEHYQGELLAAAAHLLSDGSDIEVESTFWPDLDWIQELFNEHAGTIEGYVKAGALIAAEIDRLQRVAVLAAKGEM